jgi:two-component system invasion response regulator UvrY
MSTVPSPGTAGTATNLLGLSRRELEVFLRLAKGEGLGAIAKELGLSASTVSTYRGRLVKKTGFENEVQMAHYAIRYGLIEPTVRQ